MDHEPPLKLLWERRGPIVEIDPLDVRAFVAPYSDEPIESLTLLENGCANTNYKISFKSEEPVVLRIYTRDETALMKEMATYQLLKGKIPVPEIVYANTTCQALDYPYVIMKWVDGVLMRDVVLGNDQDAIRACAFAAGECIPVLRSIQYDQAGFFNEALEVVPFSADEGFFAFVESSFKNEVIIDCLGARLVDKLHTVFDRNAALLPSNNNANLAHADFDPSNILVERRQGRYEISAVLDWEFVLAGNYLVDVGSFLRYSHQLSPVYQASFVEGMQSEKMALPERWLCAAKLMDAVSMISVLLSNPKRQRPHLKRDIVALLENTVRYFYTR